MAEPKKKTKSIALAQVGDSYRINSIKNSIEFDVGTILSKEEVKNLIDNTDYQVNVGRNTG